MFPAVSISDGGALRIVQVYQGDRTAVHARCGISASLAKSSVNRPFAGSCNRWIRSSMGGWTTEGRRLGDASAADGKSLRGSGHGARSLCYPVWCIGPATWWGRWMPIGKPMKFPNSAIYSTRSISRDKPSRSMRSIPKRIPPATPGEGQTGALVHGDQRELGHPPRSDRGRIATRVVRTPTVLNDYVGPYLGQAFRIDPHLTDGSNPGTKWHWGLRSHARCGQRWADGRGYWGIETRLPWERDRVYDENWSQIRTQNGPRVMAT